MADGVVATDMLTRIGFSFCAGPCGRSLFAVVSSWGGGVFRVCDVRFPGGAPKRAAEGPEDAAEDEPGAAASCGLFALFRIFSFFLWG